MKLGKPLKIPKPGFVCPPEGAKSFFKSFGTNFEVVNAAKSLGLKLASGDITRFIRQDEIPDYIYSALSHLVVSEELHVSSGFIEFYAKGKAVGKFYLARGVTAAVRRPR